MSRLLQPHFVALVSYTVMVMLLLQAAPVLASDHQLHLQHFHHRIVSNQTVAGYESHCHKVTEYFVNNNVQFQMCIAHKPEYLDHGNSITDLLVVRGFMPTCRVLHLMYWMLLTTLGSTTTSSSQHHGFLASSIVTNPLINYYNRDAAFVDVGANIGSCSLHFAALGVPVVAVEPLVDHIAIITGSLVANPSFQVELHHAVVSSTTKTIKAKVISQDHNWGNTTVEEVSTTATSPEATKEAVTLSQHSLDSLLRRRKVALLKLDCEGCEYEALWGARRVLHKIPMIKLELIHPTLRNGTSTVTPTQVLEFLEKHNFELFYDHWNENPFYNGRLKKVLTEIDKLFGSRRFRFTSNYQLLEEAARLILKNPITSQTFNFDQFIEKANDIIAIKSEIARHMKEYFKV